MESMHKWFCLTGWRLKTVRNSLVLVSALCLGKAAWIDMKASVAQWLIADAWEQTVAMGTPVKPWYWADTWPVARMTTPQGETLYVLSGMSGQAMAFGPAHLSASVLPGQSGNAIIAAHRDTHFAFLKQVRIGEVIRIQVMNGDTHDFVIDAMEVVDATQTRLQVSHGDAEIQLVTCFPFHALDSQGPLRYIVRARHIAVKQAARA